MSGFTKLVPEIIQSSIWNEPSDVRIVWITLLAVKDAEGYVRGDTRTIARLANVALESAETALRLFQEPDTMSHTPDNDGRRIAPAAGGWVVLNHALYRGRDAAGEHAEYMREWREKRKRDGGDVKGCDSHVNHDSASVSASVSASEHQEGDARGESAKGDLYTSPLKVDFDTFWTAYPKKVGKASALKAWTKAKDMPGIDVVVLKLAELKASAQWKKDGGQYIPNPATWLNQGRWDDEVAVVAGQDQGAMRPDDILSDEEEVIALIPCAKPKSVEWETVCVVDGSGFNLPIGANKVAEWAASFPEVDVVRTLVEIRQKVKDSGNRFLRDPSDVWSMCCTWMTKEQNGGKR